MPWYWLRVVLMSEMQQGESEEFEVSVTGFLAGCPLIIKGTQLLIFWQSFCIHTKAGSVSLNICPSLCLFDHKSNSHHVLSNRDWAHLPMLNIANLGIVLAY